MTNILIITTGGTIFSKPSNDGLKPVSLEDIKKYLTIDDDTVSLSIKELLILDSTNIQPEEWQLIARTIDEEYQNYDAIIITHGTDTMAYSASMLSYMLKGIKIPVILTGSQLPIYSPLSDARHNLILAIYMAKTKTSGVYIAFDKKIILGVRAVKVRTSNFNAFESINYKYIAKLTTYGIEINQDFLVKRDEYQFNDKIETNIFLLKLTPTTSPKILDLLVDSGTKGIVIEAFGSGGIQYIRRDFISKINELAAKNIPIVVTSQCLYEESDFNIYEVGKNAIKAGVIESYDMTTESAMTKLMHILPKTNDINEIKKIFNTNLVGEVTIKKR